MNKPIYSAFLVTICLSINSQVQGQLSPSKGADIITAIEKQEQMAMRSIMKDYPVRSIGPTVQGARITDIEVHPITKKKFYVGFASGGVFMTEDNGISFKPIFDKQGALGVGDMAISASNPEILWVGTGENNSSRSSYSGSGVYKSLDGGATWEHMGLANTQHIGKVLIHPDNSDIIWVASIGALYSKNPERGVYKTTDGGKTWTLVLYIDDATGVIDLIINPKNPDQLWAASWQRIRKAWNFDGHGKGSSIYASTDGGETWLYSSKGFTSGENVGRIGLAVSPTDPNILYALLDNQEEKEDEEEKNENPDSITFERLRSMPSKDFLALPDSQIDSFLKDQGYPKKYVAELVKKEIKKGLYKPKDIVSGDFYWFSHQNGKSIIAAVDCTGHGVPGAFMSMIGNTLLNEIVNEKQITEPAVILSELHSAILNTLQQEGEDAQSQDGMDMALCIIDQKNNLIRFAGAKNPLYIIRNGTLEMIEADIHSIGGKSYMSGKEVEPKFTGHEIPIEKNMVIYMFSDGYMDQFGGEPRKKFSSQGFKQLLLDNSKLEMHQQKAALGKAMEDWKGSYEQIDDMLVMGVRF
ncbi:MAG: SpoIIE family protein phosphatase [Bacteroidetes bacterium]|nr:SpoIIE family protein phosphatase [Bacteroidota bacterium]